MLQEIIVVLFDLQYVIWCFLTVFGLVVHRWFKRSSKSTQVEDYLTKAMDQRVSPIDIFTTISDVIDETLNQMDGQNPFDVTFLSALHN